MDAMQLRPCRHNFHKDCINKLRLHNPTVKSKEILTQVQIIRLNTDL